MRLIDGIHRDIDRRVKHGKAPRRMNTGGLGTWRANDRQQRPVPQNDGIW